MKLLSAAVTAALLLVAPARAGFDLSITEIYFGQNDPNVTEDWFEITNFGDSYWDEMTDGGLYHDDYSPDPTKADLISNLLPIGPGESAAVVIYDTADYQNPEGEPQLSDAEIISAVVGGFQDAWSNRTGLNVGAVDSSGFSSSKVDGPTIWLGDPKDEGTWLDTATYPDPESVDGLPDGASYDVALRAFSSVGNLSGAIASTGLGGGDGIIPPYQPSVASPGTSAVPEPATTLLAAAAGLTALGFRCRA